MARAALTHHVRVSGVAVGSAWGTFALSLLMLGVLVLALRWTFSRGHSLVTKKPRTGRASEYGLLVVVSEPGTFVEAEVDRQRLEAAGVRATLAPTTDGPRVLVFPEDARVARALLDAA
ncbi:hypothetical protein SAMN06264364_101273 [Quadrisphaera granulorum]|uniref:Uncharacterized protein n=1 Tax=Quadrisphaera granulorum TaxID=317664 RepID=A0A316B1A0_9ACTN|nr:hypothetical protein BXY45_101273 [Quadrisphaera granulorum]SZE94931.1 hypothetical protein SAMN06264364_101273 [Quadrisphaera granulorum]